MRNANAMRFGTNDHGHTMPSFFRMETESSSSGSGKMERIRPEKTPRQRVQKIWRNVRWANTFPDEALSMESNDLTPNFALRKIALLFETKKYEECATLIRRMNFVTLGNILTEVPLEVLYDSMPYSLSILEALYVKLYDTFSESFPKEQLCFDQLLKRMVACFAKLSYSSKTDKNKINYYPSCRNILRVVLAVEPKVKPQMKQKKKALNKCLKHLGQHGLVDCSNGHLMNLHDALKLEFDKIVTQYRSALQKLDELSLSAKHPMSSSVSFGKAPSEASHQRLMQLTRTDVQSRIIKNKTVYNIVEPAITNQCLRRLIQILEKRIEYDKYALFHDTELRKFCEGLPEQMYLSMNLKHFTEGYSVIIQLMKEIAEEDDGVSEDEDGTLSTDDELVSPLTHMETVKTFPGQLNGFVPYRGGNGGSTRRGLQEGRKRSGLRPSIISGPFPVKSDSNGIANGYSTLTSHSLHCSTIPVMNGLSEKSAEVESLELELQRLHLELDKSQEEVRNLQGREKELTERLSSQAHQQFLEKNNNFDNLSWGENRASEWIVRYGNLYSGGRMDALDALDTLQPLTDHVVLKEKILFSVVVLSFRSAQQALHELRGKLRHLMCLPHPDVSSHAQDPDQQALERHIGQYLCKTSTKFDLVSTTNEVCGQLYATLYDYPCLKECPGLETYISSCVRIAWGLSVQNPPYFLAYDARKYSPLMHTRFHTADPKCDDISNFLWPALTEGYGGPCVHKAVIVT